MWTILLVDDEVSEREGMKFLIERNQLPFTVLEASNGKQALEIIKKKKIDVLLTDIKMPYMDGLELALATHQKNPEIQIIIFSAYGEFDYAKKALQAHAVSYLLKPIELDEFSSVMEKVLGQCRENEKERLRNQYLVESNKKTLLYRLLTEELKEPLQQELEVYELNFEKKNLFLIHVETRNSFFQDWEEFFLKTVSEVCFCSFEYVNFYPNESFVILYGEQKFGKEELERFCQKMNQKIQRETGENISFFLSDPIREPGSLQQEAERIRKIKKEIYEYEPGVVWLYQFENWDFRTGEVEEIRSKLNDAIEHQRMQDVEFFLQKMITALAGTKSISVIYMHHIFYDFLDKLYMKSGIYDTELIHERINRVVSCTNFQQLSSTFSEIIREVTEKGREEDTGNVHMVNQVKQIIQQEYYKDLSLDYLAEKVNFTPAYISFVFKKETGDNLVKYITDFRMEKARYFLTETNMKIVQIGKLCGYENQSYFNRLFKNYFGMTPRQMKEKVEKKNVEEV